MATTQGMLVELLDLERIEVDIFRGRSPDENLQRVFGGQVAGQALVAAGRTVPPDRPVHSLHAYFIRPGDPDLPIVYTVDRIRDGRSFTTRRVVAVQNGRAIFALSASFQVAETGPEYQSLMPEAPDPETVPVWQERLKEYGDQVPAAGSGRARSRSATSAIRRGRRRQLVDHGSRAPWCGCEPARPCPTTPCCTCAPSPMPVT
jgi:acyl-CoA thioesterase